MLDLWISGLIHRKHLQCFCPATIIEIFISVQLLWEKKASGSGSNAFPSSLHTFLCVPAAPLREKDSFLQGPKLKFWSPIFF